MEFNVYVESRECWVISWGVAPGGKLRAGYGVSLSSVPGTGVSWGSRSSSRSSSVDTRLRRGRSADVSGLARYSRADLIWPEWGLRRATSSSAQDTDKPTDLLEEEMITVNLEKLTLISFNLLKCLVIWCLQVQTCSERRLVRLEIITQMIK